MVALTVISRRIEDLDTFIERLEATGTFRGVLSRSDEALEDGTIESNLQGYYRHAANPAPAASESQERRGGGRARRGRAMTEARGVIMRRVLREHRAWIWPLAVLRGRQRRGRGGRRAADVALGALGRARGHWRPPPMPTRPRPS